MPDQLYAQHKACKACGLEKPLLEFYPLKAGKLGCTAKCKLCVVAASKAWAAANPSRRREIRHKWNSANKPKKRSASIALRNKKKAKNPVEFARLERERVRAWAQKYPEKAAAALRKAYLKRLAKDPIGTRLKGHLAAIKRRKRAELGGGDGYTRSDIERLMHHQKGKCWWCPKILEKYHIDHLIPLAKGGPHDVRNIVLSCPKCNLKKGAKLPWQFAGRLL